MQMFVLNSSRVHQIKGKRQCEHSEWDHQVERKQCSVVKHPQEPWNDDNIVTSLLRLHSQQRMEVSWKSDAQVSEDCFVEVQPLPPAPPL